jgi:hypothetical protein
MYKLLYKLWMALAIGLGIMAFAGIIFMSYQVFILGVTGDFGIYR